MIYYSRILHFENFSKFPSAQNKRQMKKDALMSMCLDRNYDALPGECIEFDWHSRWKHDDFYSHLADRSEQTRLAIAHWKGCINAIKNIFKIKIL